MSVRPLPARKSGRRQNAFAASAPAARWFDLNCATTAFARNEEIFGEGEPAEYLYKVMTGCVRTCNTLNDGRRQIGAFYLPGEVFGLDARKVHSIAAESTTASEIRAVKRSDLMSRIVLDAGMVRLLLDLTTLELQRRQNHILLLLKNAPARVAGFLLDLAKRRGGQSEIELPMSRQDIADHLGLTIETVSRTLTRLEADATIALPAARRVVLRNRRALMRMNA
jgi:CRP/FNR family nitrogen fixation transcriptional regulator